MRIRNALPEDGETLEIIRRDAILSAAPSGMSRALAEEWAMGAAPDRIARAIREHEVWVAVDTVAVGWVEIDQDLIAALYVHPSCSGRGVGSSILSFAEAAIHSAGYWTARIEASSNALGFYLRRGYLPTGPQQFDGSIPMAKDLAESIPQAR